MLPTVANESGSTGAPWKALRLPGLAIVLVGAGAFQLDHVTVYTYVAPLLEQRGDQMPVSAFLLTVGISAIAGLFVTGIIIDRHLRLVALGAMTAFVIGMLLLATSSTIPVLIVAAIAWGLGLGASPTVFQTACARIAGTRIDQAQSLLVTIFNAGMALGSAIGGILLAQTGTPVTLALASFGIFVGIIALLLTTARRSLPSHAAALTTE